MSFSIQMTRRLYTNYCLPVYKSQVCPMACSLPQQEHTILVHWTPFGVFRLLRQTHWTEGRERQQGHMGYSSLLTNSAQPAQAEATTEVLLLQAAHDLNLYLTLAQLLRLQSASDRLPENYQALQCQPAKSECMDSESAHPSRFDESLSALQAGHQPASE